MNTKLNTKGVRDTSSRIFPSRLVFAEPSMAELKPITSSPAVFRDKVKEKLDSETAKLSEEIKKIEKNKTNADELKKILTEKMEAKVVAMIEKALVDLKITKNGKKKEKVSYLDLKNHSEPAVKALIEDIFDRTMDDYKKAVDTEVDLYYEQKRIATGKTKSALKQVPPLGSMDDLEATNAETESLQDLLAKRKDVMDKSRTARRNIVGNNPQAYLATTTYADALTSPNGGKIDDYDDGFYNPGVEDENSPTRLRLNGYLYAHDVFYGGGASGRAAMDEALKTPYELYDKTLGNRFDMNDLEEGMSLKSYFWRAEQYLNFNDDTKSHERILGMIATLLKLTDDVLKDKKNHNAYQDYLEEKLKELDRDEFRNNEEKQIQHLFTLKSPAEFLDGKEGWKGDFAKIENLTDPKREGDKVIDDYPDYSVVGEDENAENPTRHGLTGYLYAVNLFYDGDQQEIDKEYGRAYKMFKSGTNKAVRPSSIIFPNQWLEYGDLFTQEHLENAPKGENDGFALREQLVEAKQYSDSPKVQGIIAGLLKLTDTLKGPAKDNYKGYLYERLKSVKREDSEDSQIMILSTIKSPEKTEIYVKQQALISIIESAVDATTQHNQFALSDALKQSLMQDYKKLSLDDIIKIEAAVKTHIDQFVDKRAQPLQDNMKNTLQLLRDNNGALVNPLYNPTELEELDNHINETVKQIEHAQMVKGESNLKKSIESRYLIDLYEGEKSYQALMKEMHERLERIKNQAAATDPDQTPPGPVKETKEEGDDGDEGKEKVDEIEKAWFGAERVDSALGDYVGELIADTFSDEDKAPVRNNRGKLKGHLKNGTKVERTEKDSKVRARKIDSVVWVRVHFNGKERWIPEEFLHKPETEDEKPPKEDEKKKPPRRKQPEVVTPGGSSDRFYQQIAEQVERTAEGSVFDLVYNGLNMKCRAQKMMDGYHLKVNHPEAGSSDRVFGSIAQMRQYIEGGALNQYLSISILQNKENYKRLSDGHWKSDIKTIKRTGPFSLEVEFDWKRNSLFETGNAILKVNAGSDGRLHYRIEKDHIAPNGDNYRDGIVGNPMQLLGVLSRAKDWSERYERSKNSDDFEARQMREILLEEVMDNRTYDSMSRMIGKKYYFNSFYQSGYAHMYLSWYKDGYNKGHDPVLEVKLNHNGGVTWKLLKRNRQGQWMGMQGQARNAREMGRQVASVRKNPANYLTVPAQNLANLGAFGYNLVQ